MHDTLQKAAVLHAAGDLAGAGRLYREALAADPARPETHFSLAMVLLHTGDPAGAAHAFAEAARLRPGWLAPLANRGIALERLHRYAEAELALRDALRVQPDNEPVLTALAGVLHTLGRDGEAAALAERAAAVAPGRPEPWINLGLALHALGRLEAAEAAYQRAIDAVPHAPADAALAVYNLGHVLNDQWRYAEALALFRRAVELDPRYQPAWHTLLFNLLYDPAQTEQTLFDAHANWGLQQAGPQPAAQPAIAATDVASTAGARRLRVGYVSPDFRTHSCAYFLQPLFAAHDRGTVEVFAYASIERPDAMTAWFRTHTEHWRDIVGLGDPVIAAQVRADRIDVLVDLAGHTRGQPLGVFALQPAPVQVAWLGYPATSGLRQIGYRLTDALADPPDAADRLHTETLIRLAGGMHCYRGPDDAPDVAELPAARTGYVTFGSFNHPGKLNPAVVATWAGILRNLPGSRLVLKGQLLAHAAARAALTAAFTAAGIEPGRLELRRWLPRDSKPLAAYHDIDIALDTFPYNGTTTTFESLWMGVPVVTLRGERHSARVGASILTHLGRPQWIAEDSAAYAATALGLAADLTALAALRRSLRGDLRGSSLADAPGFARQIEATWRQLLHRSLQAGASGAAVPPAAT